MELLQTTKGSCKETGKMTHWGLVADEDAARLPRAHVPQAHAVVAGTSGQEVGVGVPPDHLHIRVVPCMHINVFLIR